MTTSEIHDRLKQRFGDAVAALSDPKVDPSCVVKADRIVEIGRFLRDEPGVELDYLQDLTAVDWPKRNVIEVVYHLFSFPRRHGIVLKVETDRAAPTVQTVEGLWKSANFMEREVYDLFGVQFPGHPDLRRILLPDDWVGYPLRKDYQEAGGYHGVPNLRENPLVELRRLDQVRMAEVAKQAPPTAPTAGPPPPAPPKA